MAAFIRFVFTILLVGMGINLAVVLLVNAQSQRTRARQYQEHARNFQDLIAYIDGHTRRADVIVESQQVDAHETVLQSTLLLRQYRDVGSAQTRPLPVVRIVIPGDQLLAGGLLLNFTDFSDEAGEYPMLRGHQIALFGLFCGAGEKAPTFPGTLDERFTFLPRDQVPELLRMDPGAPQASYFELKLWQYLWSLIPEIPKNVDLPWSPPPLPGAAIAPGAQPLVTWLKPATITVRRRYTYSAFISPNGITFREDESGPSGILDLMLNEGKNLNLPPE